MIRMLFVVVSICCFCATSFAQKLNLEGNWQLQDVEIVNQQDELDLISKTNCFFSYYLDSQNLVAFKENSILLYQGEESYNYQWGILEGKLVLSANNSVWIKGSSGKTEIQESLGETSFVIQRKGKELELHRQNNTFTETYTFKVAK